MDEPLPIAGSSPDLSSLAEQELHTALLETINTLSPKQQFYCSTTSSSAYNKWQINIFQSVKGRLQISSSTERAIITPSRSNSTYFTPGD